MPFDKEFWEDMYLQSSPQALPWNSGHADPDLVRLIENKRIERGQALDLGTGPGHDAVFLIQHGFDVIGIDISPSAVKLARETASHAGVFGFFQEGDVRHIPVEDAYVDFVNDRGCFHTLEPDDRHSAVEEMHRVLRPKGLALVHVFSDQEPGSDGPHRFTRHELETLFQRRFAFEDFWAGEFDGPRRAKKFSMLLRKK